MSVHKISRVLVANRGEIACRVMRTARKMGLESVAVYSEADRHSMHVKAADRAYLIGPPAAQSSYLNINTIIKTALESSAQAIHPGYGFLSESVEFANACKGNNLVFIGPPPTAIRDMGIKNKSKQIMEAAKVPVIQGYHGEDQSDERLAVESDKIGYPIMIKAVRGGGGKGMRIALNKQEFAEQLAAARREALKSFNDDKMLIEKYIQRPRHVEVQVFGDQLGNYVYLWERDCSIQRRHQKVLEEAPAPRISAETRKAIGEAAVRAAQAVNYCGAGTVEFVMDDQERFFFMEMNTRLQVEHPISEAITGQDFVEWQIRVAQGQPLPITDQAKVPFRGHAFEARIYAEDCTDPSMMLPSAGRLAFLRQPSSDKARVDSGVRQGDEISIYYDPMISKLVCWAETRDLALAKIRSALDEYKIGGLPTNIEFLKRLCDHELVREGRLDTGFIQDHVQELKPQPIVDHVHWSEILKRASLALAFLTTRPAESGSPFSRCLRVNHAHVDKRDLIVAGQVFPVEVTVHGDDAGCFTMGGSRYRLTRVCPTDATMVQIEDSAGTRSKLSMALLMDGPAHGTVHVWDHLYGVNFDLELTSKLASLDGGHQETHQGDPSRGLSPMPGVVERVLVKVGDSVVKGQPLVTLIAMKMEYTVRAGKDAKVAQVLVNEGQTANKNDLLVQLE